MVGYEYRVMALFHPRNNRTTNASPRRLTNNTLIIIAAPGSMQSTGRHKSVPAHHRASLPIQRGELCAEIEKAQRGDIENCLDSARVISVISPAVMFGITATREYSALMRHPDGRR